MFCFFFTCVSGVKKPIHHSTVSFTNVIKAVLVAVSDGPIVLVNTFKKGL